MQAEAQDHIIGRELAAFGHAGERRPKALCSVDAAAGGCGLRAGRFGEEERYDAVAHVPADQPASVDNGLVSGPYQSPTQREVVRGREPAGER